MKQKEMPLEGRQLIDAAARCAYGKKAEKLMTIDLRGRPGVADWFLICQGDNPVHNRAIADAIQDALAQSQTTPYHIEGAEQGRWVLLDYSDTVIHVLTPALRKYYQLEQVWHDCPQEEIADKYPENTEQ